MALQTLTTEHMHAAGRDAANRQMRAAGRTKWSRDDAALACKTQARLMVKYGNQYEQMAGESALQRMGLTPSTMAAKRDHVRNGALSQIYAEAAEWLECNPVESADVAIRRATQFTSMRLTTEACIVFQNNYGCWVGNDEGVLMLCFASAMADTGELDYLMGRGITYLTPSYEG